MKFRVMLLGASVALLSACAGQSLLVPTTAGNAGTTALAAYSIEGVGVNRQVQKQPTCAAVPVYPCVSQAIKDKLDAADEAAWRAAKAADAAGATQADKDEAASKLAALKKDGSDALKKN